MIPTTPFKQLMTQSYLNADNEQLKTLFNECQQLYITHLDSGNIPETFKYLTHYRLITDTLYHRGLAETIGPGVRIAEMN